MKLTEDEIHNLCKIGQKHDCCRYLILGSNGFECAKLGPHKAYLDHRVATETITARGDNCEGKATDEGSRAEPNNPPGE